MAIKNAKFSGNTFTISKAEKDTYSIDFGYNDEEDFLAYGESVEIINASKLASTVSLEITVAGNVTSLISGNGDDTIKIEKSNVSVTGGEGKDVFIINHNNSDGIITDVTITDYNGTKDTIVIDGFDNDIEFTNYTFSGRDVILNLNTYETETDDDDNETVITKTTKVTLVEAKNKLIKITNTDEDVLFYQSFQIGQADEYDATNANTGATLNSGAKYIDASARSKSLVINSTGDTDQEIIIGSKAADTIYSVGTTTIEGGNGNDAYIVRAGNHLVITDYQFGKDIIKIDGVEYNPDYEVVNNSDIRLYFDSDEGAKTTSVIIKDGLWNQTTKAANKAIKITDIEGESIDITNANKVPDVGFAFKDPNHLYVTSVAANNNKFDLSTATNLGSAFSLVEENEEASNTKVQNITFTAKQAVSLVAGGAFSTITSGSGSDTIYGSNADTAVYKKDLLKAGSFQYSDTNEIKKTSDDDDEYPYGGYEFEFIANKVGYAPFTIYVSVKTVQNDEAEGSEEVYVGVPYRIYTKTDGIINSESIIEIPDDNGNSHDFEGTSFKFTTLDKLADLKFDMTDLAIAFGSSRAKVANTIARYSFNNDGQGLEYNYTYNPADTFLNAGAGNDYLFGNIGGGTFLGGAGADTLRGGKGNATFEGGAGNDTFLLTGEGNPGTYYTVRSSEEDGVDEEDIEVTTLVSGNTVHVITDYNLEGTDKIVVANDNYKTKDLTEGVSAQSKIIGGHINESNQLEITVSGALWKGTESEWDSDPEADNEDYVYADFDTENATSSTYVFQSLGNDKVISITEQGITYKQLLTSENSIEMNNSNFSNYLGTLNDNVEEINGSEMKKAQRIVAGGATTEIIGGKAADTIIGNGKTAMTGGTGNDIFVVKAGDSITDYGDDAKDKEKGKDTIRLAEGVTFHDLNDLASPAETKETAIKSYTTEIRAAEGANVKNGPWAITITLGNGDQYVVTFESTDDNNVLKFTSIEPVLDDDGESINNENYTYPDIEKVLETTFPEGKFSSEDVVNALNEIWKDVIIYEVKATLKTNADGEAISNSINGDDVVIGGINIAEGAGKTLTIQQVTEEKTAKNGKYTGTKTVTQTMIRKFEEDMETLNGGASTYLEAYNGIDDDVKVIKGGTKAAKIVNSAKNVESIVGGAQAETIEIGNSSAETMYVSGGKGNDVFIWNGSQDVVIKDFASVTIKNGKISSGDVIVLDGLMSGELEEIAFDGNDVKITAAATGKRGTLTLSNAKDANAYIYYNVKDKIEETDDDNNVTNTTLVKTDYNSAAKISEEDDNFILLNNSEEYAIKGNAYFSESNLSGSIKIVNAEKANKKQPVIDLRTSGSSVETVYGSKNADTVYAGSSTDMITAGAGADVIFTGSAENQTITTGAGADVIVFGTAANNANIKVTDYVVGTDKIYLADDVKITSASYVYDTEGNATGATIQGTGKNSNTYTYYSDVVLNLSNGAVVTFDTIASANIGISVVKGDSPSGQITTTLDYFNDKITIGSGNASNSDCDLSGVTATSITVAKAAKNTTVKSAQGGSAVEVANGNKNAVYYIGNYVQNADEQSTLQAVTFTGGAGADVYVGRGAVDTVNLGAGNDTYRQATSAENGGTAAVVRASITSGSGNNTFIVGSGDDYHISSFGTGDRLVLDSLSSAYSATLVDKDLTLIFKTSGNDATVKFGTVNISGYENEKIAISQIVAGKNGKASVTSYSAFNYGNTSLKVTNADTAQVVVDNQVLGATIATVDAATRTTSIDITGSASVKNIIGGKKADTLRFAYGVDDATVTSGAGADLIVYDATYTTTNSINKLTITDYSGDAVSVVGAFGTGDYTFANYNGKYSFDGSDLIIKDSKAKVIFKNAVTTDSKSGVRSAAKITVNGKKNISLSDPNNVVVANKDVNVDFDALGGADAIEKLNAKNATKNAVKLTTGTNFTSLVAGSAGTTLDMSKNTANSVIVGGAGVDLVTLGGGIDRFTYNGGEDVIADFAKVEADEINLNGWSVSGNAIVEEQSDSTATVTLTLTKSKAKGKLKITGKISNYFKLESGNLTINGITNPIAYSSEASFKEHWFTEDNNVATTGLDEITSTDKDSAAVAVDYTSTVKDTFGTTSITANLTDNKKNQK